MSKLYPIGTQLITRRPSQADLYIEFFKAKNSLPASVFTVTWRVIVTEENQKWLSPVPIVGDKVQYHDSPYCSNKITNIISNSNNVGIFFVKDDPSTDIDPEEYTLHSAHITDILKRLYPNGQRAPMLEWDEVILPEKGYLL